jgi:predicted Holliday junction resolvase-like endonuclease
LFRIKENVQKSVKHQIKEKEIKEKLELERQKELQENEEKEKDEQLRQQQISKPSKQVIILTIFTKNFD